MPSVSVQSVVFSSGQMMSSDWRCNCSLVSSFLNFLKSNPAYNTFSCISLIMSSPIFSSSLPSTIRSWMRRVFLSQFSSTFLVLSIFLSVKAICFSACFFRSSMSICSISPYRVSMRWMKKPSMMSLGTMNDNTVLGSIIMRCR